MALKNKIKKLSDEEIKIDREIVLNFINRKQQKPVTTSVSTSQGLTPSKIALKIEPTPAKTNFVSKLAASTNKQTNPAKTSKVINPESAESIKSKQIKSSVQETEKNSTTNELTKHKPLRKNYQRTEVTASIKLKSIPNIETGKISFSNILEQKNNPIVKKNSFKSNHLSFKNLLKLFFSASLIFLITFFAVYALFWLVFNAINLN